MSPISHAISGLSIQEDYLYFVILLGVQQIEHFLLMLIKLDF
ncbi:hypothetical protein [Rickettsia endosymbiont of Polydrusus tereticollis]